MADLADLHFLPVANRNTGRMVNGMASVHMASTIFDHVGCETLSLGRCWIDDVGQHESPSAVVKFVEVSDRLGLEIKLHRATVRAQLADREISGAEAAAAGCAEAVGGEPG